MMGHPGGVVPPAFAMGLTAEQSRAWVAYMQVGLRMTHEMNRQLGQTIKLGPVASLRGAG
jgi:hypothetical protein